jgi:hypothetical protein
VASAKISLAQEIVAGEHNMLARAGASDFRALLAAASQQLDSRIPAAIGEFRVERAGRA